MAFVRKTRQWLGHGEERLDGCHLPNKPERSKKKQKMDSGDRRGREKEREKFETGRDIFLISGDMNH